MAFNNIVSVILNVVKNLAHNIARSFVLLRMTLVKYSVFNLCI